VRCWLTTTTVLYLTVQTSNSGAAHLLHATLQMGYFGATEMMLNHTKYKKVGSYESGRLN
jgi:hypothetical protein